MGARLALTLSVVVGLVLGPVAVEATERIISPEEAYQATTEGKLTLIDIRTPREWRLSGLPQGAQPITMHNPAGKNAFVAEVRAAVGGDLDRPIALICAAGERSRWAQQLLAAHGFTDVLDLSEGLFGRGSDKPGWIARGLPLEPCARC